MVVSSNCGFSFWHPKWLNIFASARWFVFVYGMLGAIRASHGSYSSVTLSTLEKRFKLPSQTTGYNHFKRKKIKTKILLHI